MSSCQKVGTAYCYRRSEFKGWLHAITDGRPTITKEELSKPEAVARVTGIIQAAQAKEKDIESECDPLAVVTEEVTRLRANIGTLTATAVSSENVEQLHKQVLQLELQTQAQAQTLARLEARPVPSSGRTYCPQCTIS